MSLLVNTPWMRLNGTSTSTLRRPRAIVWMLAVAACISVLIWKTGFVYSLTNSQGHDKQSSLRPSAGDRPSNHPVAVIIETDITPNLIPVMLHFSWVLGPLWTVILFTLEENWKQPQSRALQRAMSDKQIEVRFLPAGTKLSDSGSVSRFLTKPWLWDQVYAADRVLLFQTDSIICSKADMAVDDFLIYDFAGAPIDAAYGQGYNGGLSIRNPKLFSQITKEADFESSPDEFEDQWFFKQAQARITSQGVQLPTPDIAKTFSVETIYYDKPVGYHQPTRWQTAKISEIEAYCPEVRMLVGRRAT